MDKPQRPHQAPLGIMAGIWGAMGTPPHTGVRGGRGTCKNQYKAAAFYQYQADSRAPCTAGVANLCANSPCPSWHHLPTEPSFATQAARPSGDLFIFFFLLDEILWLNTL